MAFDPDAAAQPGSGIFGLTCSRADSRIVLVPVPYDATTSYRPGTADGPRAIREASMQVDLYDRRFGRVYEHGIFMEDEDERIRLMGSKAAAFARPLLEQGGAGPDDSPAVARVNAAGESVNDFVARQVSRILDENKVPGVIGGEHSVPFGAIQACAQRFGGAPGGLGILHLDAHMDFRHAFEGFVWSHASIMHNVLTHVPQVTKLVQVGIRDFGEGELAFAKSQGSRVAIHFDDAWAEELARGKTTFLELCSRAIQDLPRHVYVSFDIDALDPSLCPHTGTPVPGGLSFNQATLLLDALKQSGRTVVGFDLVEVAPGPTGAPEWDANVGARVLYKLCGVAASGSGV
ncbi:MAG: agmatinase family protein [Planctomycetota bacterium]|nr:agmatinase family protein [Planctomycetota bacterium]